MPQKLGYIVDLSRCQFDENGHGWIQAMPYGLFTHPVYGEIDITPERVQRFAANVKSGVRGQDLDIDYDHKQKTSEAAGWVKDAEVRSDGLWLLVEWTKSAWTKIKEKAYRYFSPELVDEWQHPSTGVKYQDVLFGGGLTNRPFLKGILPINLSELFDEPGATESVGGQMDPKQLRLLLGLPEDATDDQVTSSIEGLKTGAKGTPTDKKDENQLVLASELVKALGENNPKIKLLAEKFEAQEREIQELKASRRLSEATSVTKKLTEPFESEGISVAFGEPVRDALQEVLLLSGPELTEKITKLFDELRKGIVPLGEVGGSYRHEGDEGAAQAIKAFSDAIAVVQKERDISYADASIVVSSEKPQLFEEYRQASFAGRE